MTGFAAIPGIAVDPMWSIRGIVSSAASKARRMVVATCWNAAGQVSSYPLRMIGSDIVLMLILDSGCVNWLAFRLGEPIDCQVLTFSTPGATSSSLRRRFRQVKPAFLACGLGS